MTFPEMVTGSILVRFMAIIILFMVMIACIIVATVDLLLNRSIPSVICTILGVGIGTSGTLVGINFGVVLQPAIPSANASSTTITVSNPPGA